VEPAEDSFNADVLDRLSTLDRLGCRAMFGGYALYRGRTFFGILFAGRLYFKTNEATVDEYLRHGVRPFQSRDNKVLRDFYEVPGVILEERERLRAWATAAAATAAARAQAASHTSAALPLYTRATR
jgi:DNA transformation protein